MCATYMQYNLGIYVNIIINNIYIWRLSIRKVKYLCLWFIPWKVLQVDIVRNYMIYV